jgi:hypothetical protein
MPDDTNALKQVNRSGFPFQLKVEHDIRATEQRHKWSVASREHPWTSPEGNSGFIDIVLKSSGACLVIECKRVRADDASQLQWLFLVEEAKSDLTGEASSFYVEAALDVRGWNDVRISPYSLESQFCVLQGDEPRRSLLENLAKGLLQSTEGLAQEEISVYQSIKASRQHGFRLGESSDAPLQVRFFFFR